MTRYISVTDTAKLVRQALSRNFPGTKFSVKSDSYSGGASIQVSWTDGPTANMVEFITSQYKGGRFDGSIDMAYSVTSYLLPDGSACVANNPGSTGQRGTHEGERNFKPSPDAERVHFSADYIFCKRMYSVDMVRRALEAVARKWGGFDPNEIDIKYDGHFGATAVDTHKIKMDCFTGELTFLLYEELARRASSLYLRSSLSGARKKKKAA
jgi:hypothetical protein